MERKYDLIIIGAGPSGIFTALTVASISDLRVVIIDKGGDISERMKNEEKGLFPSLLNGWGGAGAFSDGKLTLSPYIGGWLMEYVGYDRLRELIKIVDDTFVKFGAPKKIFGDDPEIVDKIGYLAQKAGMRLIPERIRHMGREYAKIVILNMKKYLEKKGVDIMLHTKVNHVLVENGKVKGVELEDGDRIYSKYVVMAPGRGGASWLEGEAHRLGLSFKTNPIDLGIRIEVSAAVMEPLTSALYEPKLIYNTREFDDIVRTFCVNPYGIVVTERYDDIITVNGESFATKKSENTNFALLVTVKFTEPFKEPIAYGKYIARLANMISGGVIIQRLGDLKKGRRSTIERIERNPIKPTLKTAVPGDLSFVLPYRFIVNILEMIEALDYLAPGVNSNHTLLYGIEVKFYSLRININSEMETEIKNLYAIGDGAGITRSLVQSSASGILAGESILRKEGILKKNKVEMEFSGHSLL